jgi:hypothetical protein
MHAGPFGHGTQKKERKKKIGRERQQEGKNRTALIPNVKGLYSLGIFFRGFSRENERNKDE